MRKVALVTGASGFIGHHICKALMSINYNVIAVGTKDENAPECDIFLKSPLLEIPFDKLPEINVCLHQAANNDTTDKDEESMLLSNVYNPMLFFEKLINKKCKKFIYASSCSVYGNESIPYQENTTKINPLNAYAKSKAEFDNYMKYFSNKFNAKTIGLRYTNVYGPGEEHKGKRASMITQIINHINEGKIPTIFKDGEQKRDWVHVNDVVKANLKACETDTSGVFNIGSGESISFNELVELISKEMESPLIPEYLDCPYGNAYQTNTLADISEASEKLNYYPEFDLKTSIKSYVKIKNENFSKIFVEI